MDYLDAERARTIKTILNIQSIRKKELSRKPPYGAEREDEIGGDLFSEDRVNGKRTKPIPPLSFTINRDFDHRANAQKLPTDFV
jgi:hypothetical protein